MNANLRLATLVALVVVALAIGAAVFRASTGPDRKAERLRVAQQTCEKTGGTWIAGARDAWCRKPELATR